MEAKKSVVSNRLPGNTDEEGKAMDQFEAYLATKPGFLLVYFSQISYPVLVIDADDMNHGTSPLQLACYEPHFKYFHSHPTGHKLFELKYAKAYIPDEFDWDLNLDLSKVVRL